jgi:hypothetical protein
MKVMFWRNISPPCSGLKSKSSKKTASKPSCLWETEDDVEKEVNFEETCQFPLALPMLQWEPIGDRRRVIRFLPENGNFCRYKATGERSLCVCGGRGWSENQGLCSHCA